MPIFEYSCANCGQDFETLVRNADAMEQVSCPVCSDNEVVRKFSAFSTAISTKEPPAAKATVPSAPCGPACGCHH